HARSRFTSATRTQNSRYWRGRRFTKGGLCDLDQAPRRGVEQLSETAPTWAQAVAPFAERIAKGLWSTIHTSKREISPAIRITRQHRRDAKGQPLKPIARPRTPPRL